MNGEFLRTLSRNRPHGASRIFPFHFPCYLPLRLHRTKKPNVPAFPFQVRSESLIYAMSNFLLTIVFHFVGTSCSTRTRMIQRHGRTAGNNRPKPFVPARTAACFTHSSPEILLHLGVLKMSQAVSTRQMACHLAPSSIPSRVAASSVLRFRTGGEKHRSFSIPHRQTSSFDGEDVIHRIGRRVFVKICLVPPHKSEHYLCLSSIGTIHTLQNRSHTTVAAFLMLSRHLSPTKRNGYPHH